MGEPITSKSLILEDCLELAAYVPDCRIDPDTLRAMAQEVRELRKSHAELASCVDRMLGTVGYWRGRIIGLFPGPDASVLAAARATLARAKEIMTP